MTQPRTLLALTLVAVLAYARHRGKSEYHRMYVDFNGSLAE